MLSSSIRSFRSLRSLDEGIGVQTQQQQPLKSCIRRERSPSQEFQLKKVIFDEIEVKEYPRMLGDNPAVSEGVPLTIGWKPQSSYSMDIDLFESMRCSVRRRGRKQLLISSMRRVQSLVEAGYSLEKIGETIVQVDTAKHLRFESATESGWNFSKVFGGLQAAIHGLKIKQPKRKSVTNPAC
eukprot:CAMPEP_0116134918 /NCGR_PEP_ID=MMETSP0329-20121206/10913_1 /TAXON_ID=697910 /ORGANISM="Pseudo-nitzschia arenysensis, Strain B593" /LENGTH=181 /DNA_ID=CAMNT_0003629683 /DNA_START=173 /DNA_END=718 /DNA_ORIENTATION=-